MTERFLFSVVLVGLCALSALAVSEVFQPPAATVAAREPAPAVELPRVVITAQRATAPQPQVTLAPAPAAAPARAS